MRDRIRLTRAKIADLSIEKYGEWVVDSEVPQLVVRLSGDDEKPTKTFYARWTSKVTGKRRSVRIDSCNLISIDNARDAARKLVSEDGNPTVQTLADIYRIWDEFHASKVGTGHATEFRRAWRLHIEPVLGDKKLARLTPSIVRDWYDALRPKYAPDTVNRFVAYVSKLCGIARVSGWMVGNPVEGLEKSSPVRRVDIFTTDEIKAVAANLKAVADKYPMGVALLRFMMIFPARGIEVRTLRHDELDLEAGTWTIPGARYKTGKDKVFPLGPQQIAHLRSLPRWSETYVFPSPTDPTQPMRKEYQRDVWEKVRPARKLGAHTLRKTIATGLLNNDVPLEIVSKLLGHSSTAVTQAIYAHLAPSTARRYLDLIPDVLEDDKPIPELDEEGRMLQAFALARIAKEERAG